jgi:hypothetical protein
MSRCIRRAMHLGSLGAWLLLALGLSVAGRELTLVEAVKNRDTRTARALLAGKTDVNAPSTTTWRWPPRSCARGPRLLPLTGSA